MYLKHDGKVLLKLVPFSRQNVLIMKMMSFLLLVICLQLSARGVSQTVTLSFTNTSLTRVFSEIKSQTGYVFMVNNQVLKNTRPVSIQIHKMSLSDALPVILKDQDLDFLVEKNIIFIKAASKSRHTTNSDLFQATVFFPVTGIVKDSSGSPLADVTIVVKGTKTAVKTDSMGYFSINAISGQILLISIVGYQPIEHRITDETTKLYFTLKNNIAELDNIEITSISTGYQSIPKERVTGSFVHVDNELLNKRVSPDIISRLADNVPGLVFNRSGALRTGAQTAISIRGQNTIFGREDPLIVLNNFPYTGDINLINPNDIESITILKDAAAASIWGAQSSNGVIVINTKNGKFNQPAKVSFNSNITVGSKPDLFYLPTMSTSDYIDMEKLLFERGYFAGFENNDEKTALTPVVELLIAQRDGKILASDAQSQINALRTLDVRDDIGNYLYRNALNQQYAVSVRGGSATHRYFMSAGYDKNLSASMGDSYNRTTLNASNTFMLLKQKLEFTTSIYYTASKSELNSISMGQLNIANAKPIPYYTRLADDSGMPVFIPHSYRVSFIDQSMQRGLLDWRYSPQQEINVGDNSAGLADLRVNLNALYRITSSLSFQMLYQYNKIDDKKRNRQSKDKWYTRDIINRFTSVNPDGSLKRPVPLGDILDINDLSTIGHSLRAQLNYNKDWSKAGNLIALAGAEIRGLHSIGYSTAYYGFDNDVATSAPVNYLTPYTSYVNPSSTYNLIPNYANVADLTDRYISYYGNAAYTYQGKYTLSASARLDQSNLFGVKANQKGVPLYSAGLSWKLSNEHFYQLSWLPYVNIRATFGYNGNIDKSLSAYTTALFSGVSSLTRVPFARIINPPNPQLRWERTRIVNLGIDFKLKNNRVIGSVEYYVKNGIDLIGEAPLAPQTGIVNFKGNTANTKGHGFDISLTSENLKGYLGWQTSVIASYATDKVSKYLISPTGIGAYVNGIGNVPTEGRPLYAVYSYKWAGLNALTGDPQGYVKSAVSSDYNAISSSTTLNELKYNGTMRPLIFGAVRNTFSFHRLSLSANISYRLNYYIRTPSINYSTVLEGNGGHGDYYSRWMKPGDELSTHVPSMPAAINSARDAFYANSSVLVKRGDHIRLQDIHLSYSFDKQRISWLPFNNAQLYLYANNIGILYKKVEGSLDPDYLSSAPPARSLAVGLKVDW